MAYNKFTYKAPTDELSLAVFSAYSQHRSFHPRQESAFAAAMIFIGRGKLALQADKKELHL